jgi:hypothetical protein
MQARRSSLYVKPKVPFFFEDDFTTIPNGQVLNGKTPSGGTGHWQDSSYTTKSIKVVSGQAVPPDTSNTICTAYAVPDGNFVGEDRIRVTASLTIVGGAHVGSMVGFNIWGGDIKQQSGVFLYLYKVNTSSGSRLKVSIYNPPTIIDYFTSGNNDYADEAHSFETHVEKLSSTRIKTGVKFDGVWVKAVEEHTVVPGFFNVPNRATLLLRNSGGHGIKADNFKIDDQVDW